MKKRILSLAVVFTLLVSMFAVFNVFADTYTQRVALKSYQPAVRTLIHDDDFNDIPVTGSYASIKNSDRSYPSDYNAIWIGDADGYEVESGNNALAFSAAWKHIQFNRTSNSDKLVVSFDMFDTSTSSFGFRLINKGNTSAYAVLLNPWTSTGALITNGETVASSLGISSLGNKWVNVTMIFERVLNSAGTGYEASLKQFYLDGKLYDNLNATPTSNIDWWTRTSTVNFSIQTLSATVKIDNLLVYEPKAETMITTNVKVPSNVPAVKNIILDDDFESSTHSGTSLSSTQSNSFSTIYNVGQLGETEGNHYPVTNAYAPFYSKHTGVSDAKRLVMTFKIKAPSTVTTSYSYFNMAFNSKKDVSVTYFLRPTFALIDDSTDANNGKYKTNIQVMTTGNYAGSNLSTTDVYINPTDFVKYTLVMDKTENSDGSYSAYVTALYINDNPVTLTSSASNNALRSNWFTTTDASYSTLYLGNSGAAGWSLDDFLVYEPVDFNVSDMILASNGTNADITFTDDVVNTANASVTATPAVGSAVTSTLECSGKTVTATFDTALDLTRNVYTISVVGVTSARGDTLSHYSKVIGTGFESIDKATNKATIRNNGNTVLLGKLIVAAYDSSDNLVNAAVNTTDISAPVDLSTNMTYTLPSGDNIAYYKFFAWNDTETLTPLFTNVTID